MWMTDEQMNKKYKKEYQLGLKTLPDFSLIQFDGLGENYDGDYEKVSEIQNKNKALVYGWNDGAKKAGRLVGRLITEPHADGYAWYVIVEEKKTVVKLQVVRNIGDDWNPWGEYPSMNKKDIVNLLNSEDKWNRLIDRTKKRQSKLVDRTKKRQSKEEKELQKDEDYCIKNGLL